VTIRLYAELNDFVPPDRRQRDLAVSFGVTPSVKDAIEGLGVPHTEVDLVLVNGEPVAFDHRLAIGDRVSVYPVFERLDISAMTRVRAEPLRDVRFVTDVHLGKLCRYLRLLGFDTVGDAAWSDEELAGVSVTQRRILLTRDRGLLKRRAVTHGLFVRHDDPDDQLVDVVQRLHLGTRLRPFSRCMACNGTIEEVAKASVAGQLPAGSRRTTERLRRCSRCGRVYWEGAHLPRLHALVERARTECCGRPGA
jgi:uncharacterized protein with PIN domain